MAPKRGRGRAQNFSHHFFQESFSREREVEMELEGTVNDVKGETERGEKCLSGKMAEAHDDEGVDGRSLLRALAHASRGTPSWSSP